MHLRVAFVVATVALIGCKDAALADKMAGIDKRLTAIETEVSNLKTLRFQVNAISSEVGELRSTMAPAREEAWLDSSSVGYDFVVTRAGIFPVSFRNVTPVGDGQRVTFVIGNPYNATYAGFKMTVKFGPRYPDAKDFPDKEKWDAAWKEAIAGEKTREYSLTNVLHPGSWNSVSVVLAPATPRDVGRLQVSLDMNQIRLRQ